LPGDKYASSGHEADDPEQEKSEGEAPLYVISVAAKLVRLPAWTLRVLDEQGIVVPKRTGKNRRLYSDSDLSKLVRVRSLTEELGVNMSGVRIILQLEEQNNINGSSQKP
jgi:MerR family transcriptional regulator/heat shock protein HspR